MVLDTFNLAGKVAIVTGANSGLGQGMAVGLAEAGTDIVAVHRSDDIKDTREKVEALGRRFVSVKADLGSTQPVQHIIDSAVEALGRVDILVNNAGIIRRTDAVEYTEKDWDDTITTNLKVVFFLSQAAAKQFIKQKTGGKIINIASMLSYQGGIRVPAYTASKSGIMGVTKALANEWAKYGINVNAIAPGYMDTNNTSQLRQDEERNKDILDRIPAGRWGLPSDMMGPVVFLSSSASDYVNGYTIAVDGGWLAR